MRNMATLTNTELLVEDIQIDGHYFQSLIGELLLKIVHPREGLAAGITPRRPEIEIDYMAAQAVEGNGALGGGKAEGRCGIGKGRTQN